MDVSFALTDYGRLVCHRCGKTGNIMEGHPKTVASMLARACDFRKCGFAGTMVDVKDNDPAFIQLWTKLTGEAPKPFED